jgi:predicted TIM-barrel fold metal-dependent hydrolase
MILGHIGRIDQWLEKRDRGRALPSQQTIRTYFEKNIFITTAGYFSTPALIHAMMEISVERILFSIDTPYANITEGAEWLDTTSISRLDREKIGRGNALKLFPRLQKVLNSEEVVSRQKNREPVIFTTNKGFE